MATKLVMRVAPGGLRCANEAEAEKLEGLHGREVMVTISQPRNIRFHKKFFAMLHAALQMADLEVSAEQWRAMVTAGAGWCDFVPGRDGLIAVPRSIAFGSMDETEFAKLYEDCIRFICANYLPDTTPEALADAAEFVGFL